ncbi:hypothetical protein [Streptomyces sp. NPDC048057]|uniref:DUF7417 domain-containing protein n=1 Tax=Streptomyces sp. NPDC048057 TaxID=3155628 RepID=UPI0033F61D8F
MGRMKDVAIELGSFEMGELSPRETLDLFSLLVKSGLAWTLQGSYGRTAIELVQAGYLTRDGDVSEFADELLEGVAAT